MTGHSPLRTLIKSGTKLWLDSIDPDLVKESFALGATGATSNPIIVSDLLKTGRFDDQLKSFLAKGLSVEEATWAMTDWLVTQAETVFLPIYEQTKGNDGYVSFEVDPLIEEGTLSLAEQVERYVELGKKWSKGHPNRMIKVPATPAGLKALTPLASHGVPLNVTLIFSKRQYHEARENVWAGAKQLKSLDKFKSVYSIFVSRLDVYAEAHVKDLSPEAQAQVGILNAKEVWFENSEFWRSHKTPLSQEMIFASTGTKKPLDKPWRYVAAFAGSDIETNPPQTNKLTEASGESFTRQIDKLPAPELVKEIHAKVDWHKLEVVLMEEALKKFADPQKALLKFVAEKAGK